MPSNAAPPSVTISSPTSSTTQGSTVATTSHRTTNTVTCDFDYDLCGWTQLTTDFFDWTRQKGGTILPGTGPSGDHTSGREIAVLFF
ncbi:hypothetical protein DPMN_011670 [Dreissena polymorpha]|uniref:MAM domain-containing protein n=1 Tax=Dreissena polymorpha TaxID=45954 RepID=A0A9D4N6K5_DREPO|nr:hypothetical protein DPMN_011670 [Dreissena polymorpha]